MAETLVANLKHSPKFGVGVVKASTQVEFYIIVYRVRTVQHGGYTNVNRYNTFAIVRASGITLINRKEQVMKLEYYDQALPDRLQAHLDKAIENLFN